jgi:hypothetical protein
VRRFRETASAGTFHLHRVAGQHSRSLTAVSTQYLAPSKQLPTGSKLLCWVPGTRYWVLAIAYPSLPSQDAL